MRVVRILGALEPGGAQLSALWLSVALRRHGIATTLLAGDATPSGLELAARYGLPADAYRVSEVLAPDSLQWTPAPEFADWLGPRLARAGLVDAQMVGAWWAAARAVLERITYANEDTGYTIARVATGRAGPDLLTMAGPLLGAQVGASLWLTGRWSSHPKYGRRERRRWSVTSAQYLAIRYTARLAEAGAITCAGGS